MAERFVSGWAEGTIGPHFADDPERGPAGAGRRRPGRHPDRHPAGPLPAGGSGMLSPYIVAAQATPILALAPLIALWFGTGLAEPAAHLRAHLLLPDRGRDHGRHPLGRPAARRAGPQPAGHALAAAAAASRCPRRCRRSWAACASASRSRSWAPSWPSGRAATSGLGVLINLARGSMFDIPLMFATLFTIAAARRGALPPRRLHRAPARAGARLRPAKGRRPCRHRTLDPAPGRPSGWRLAAPARARAAVLLLTGPPARLAQSRRPAPPRSLTTADRRPGLHPQRPVRPVLPGRRGGLLRATPAWTSRSRTRSTRSSSR